MKKIKHSLRKQMILLLVTAVVLSVGGMATVIYGYMSNDLREQAIQENFNLLHQGQINIKNYMDRMLQLTTYPYSNEQVYAALKRKQGDSYEDTIAIRIMMNNLVNSDKDIYQVHLFAHHSGLDYYYIGGRAFQFYISRGDNQESIPPYRILPTQPSGTYGIDTVPKPQSLPVFTIERPLYAIPEGGYLGTLHIDILLDSLMGISDRLLNDPSETLLLFDDGGHLLYKTGPNEDPDVIPSILETTGLEGAFANEHAGGYLLYSKITVGGAKLVFG